MNILIFGRSGQVADAIERSAGDQELRLTFLGRSDFDLLSEDAGRPIKRLRPSAVVNAAAYTAVDRAESEPQAAHRLNAEAVGEMARAAAALAIPFIHVSTDYVFDGSKDGPYVEEDATSPLSVYGRTKLQGEVEAQEAAGDWTIFRTAWVVSPFGGNFVKTMLKLGRERDDVSVVDDQFGRPTLASDIADACLAACRDRKVAGLHHLAGADDATWADVADRVFARLSQYGRRPRLQRISTNDYPTAARRPMNSRLDTAKLQQSGWRPRAWRETIDVCLDELLQNT